RPAALREVVGVDLGVLLPLVRELVLGEAGVDRARLDAGVAVDALLRVDVEHLGRVGSGLVGRRVDAIHGAHLDTGVVLGADARLGDYVGHSLLSESVAVGLGRGEAARGAYCTNHAALDRCDRPGGVESTRPSARRRGPGEVPGARSAAPRDPARARPDRARRPYGPALVPQRTARGGHGRPPGGGDPRPAQGL